MVTDEEAKALARVAAQTAAREVLHELFVSLGVDIDDPTEMQRDMAFLRQWRESSSAIKRQAGIVVLGLFLAGLAGLIVAWIKAP
jgi:hypothetical protein